MGDVTGSDLVKRGMRLKKQHFPWRIENFGIIRKRKDLIKHQKKAFTLKDSFGRSYQWRVFLQEKIEYDNKRWVNIYFQLEAPTSAETSISEQGYVKFKVVIKNANWMTQTRWIILETGILNVGSYVKGWGWSKVIAADNENNLKGDFLHFEVKSKLWTPATLESQHAELAANARKDLAKLLENPIPCNDIKLISNDGVEFTAQKGILAVRSPMFEAMLRTDMKEGKEGIIRLPDISSKTLRILLHFFYTGELLPSWSQAGVLVELTNSAAKYQHNDLLSFLDVAMGKVCCLENVGALLILSNQLSLKTAEVELLNFLREKSLKSPAICFKMFEGIAAPEPVVRQNKLRLQSVLMAICCSFGLCVGSRDARKKE